MSELAAVGLALTSLRTAFDMTKGFLSVRDAVISQGQIFELQRQILSAQEGAINASSAQSSLLEEISALKKRISDMETWDTEKQRYEMQSVSKGTVTFVLKKSMSNGEPAHWLCARCYTDRQKGFLHTSNVPSKGQYKDGAPWACTICPTIYSITYGKYPSYADEGCSHDST